MPHLEVKVGPDYKHMEPCRVNDISRPHEIDTDYFVGRVVVRILDAPGAKEGEDGREYFRDRSRRFCIQIEGRFKQRYTGDDVHFGTDFDRFMDFPRAPFNAGMRVARYIDPCTFYEEKPPSGRPYIMSPYCACMNVLCAWPAPSRAHDAVVVLRHTDKSGTPTGGSQGGHSITPTVSNPEKGGDGHSALLAGQDDDDETQDIVPREGLSRNASVSRQSTADAKPAKKKGWLSGVGNAFGGGAAKEERVLKKYWRFVGFKDEPRVRALLEAHHAKLEHHRRLPQELRKPERTDSAMSTESGTHAGDVQHGIASDHPTLKRLGTNFRGKLSNMRWDDPETPPQGAVGEQSQDGDVSPLADDEAAVKHDYFVTAPEATGQDILESPERRAVSPAPLEVDSATSTRDDTRSSPPSAAMPPLQRITTQVRTEAQKAAASDGLKSDDFRLADDLNRKARLSSDSHSKWSSKLDDQLGPWRFSEPGTDMVEDNAFIFTTHSLSVPKRRKYFTSEENRKNFEYDPDIVYGASFFTDAFDFNTLSLSLGPVKLGLTKFFGPNGMPIRYTLRHRNEEPSFVTVSFQLVD
ncbi:hypothetical protein BCV69DRAFT_244036 [Microstroma glucosiphilum]|uniref:Domain of unknown function at the cortex 1 domain-containing protein n=1 Tax=Pseudomicrostroma glucosiphilum TaxID=1684307 RepID=A0A316UKV8_9BASI|nr:hypothetical protein BCV69DRAFT_244036 [Pseudomicrostroma glucosiphilum]PWN23865.1 hypothetical protein BCV69DRAFT_244036 [Pseudomicrostroma glucosiphilum]